MKMSNPLNSTELLSYTKVYSVGAMVSTNYVQESIEEIYELINK
jgi:hypothetical protein